MTGDKIRTALVKIDELRELTGLEEEKEDLLSLVSSLEDAINDENFVRAESLARQIWHTCLSVSEILELGGYEQFEPQKDGGVT